MDAQFITQPNVLIPALVGVSACTLGGAALVAHLGRRQRFHQRILGTTTSGASATTRLTGRLAQLGQNLHNQRDAPDLHQRLARAGYYNPAAPLVYLGTQGLLAILALVAALPLALAIELPLALRLCILVALVGGGALLPAIVVAALRRRRTRFVRNSLPDAIDLLEVCVSAGMGLDAAWNAVAQQVRQINPTLGDEMALANLEMQLGATRPDALRHMASRTGAEELRSLVAVLNQSERFGTSVSQALRSFAEAMRRGRSQQAEEAAERMSVKLLFPMLVFIFPVLLIVILGPAMLRIADTFASFGAG
jgi:tight adherence protein C